MPFLTLPRNVLVTGAGGYIGALLVRELLARGHHVVAVDRLYFGAEPLAAVADHPRFRLLHIDTVQLQATHLVGVDAVVDLAALSNDPAADLMPAWTEQTNHLARVRLARLARCAGVRRHVLVSSSSVYGEATGEVDETAPVAPATCYAATAARAEAGVLEEARHGLDALVLRLATVHGGSPRMRFDLVVNTMTLHAMRHGVIRAHGGGGQWRPHVGVADVCRAVLAALAAPAARLAGETFNIGCENLRIIDVAERVRDTVRHATGRRVQIVRAGDQAELSYQVRFDKAARMLGFQANETMTAQIGQLVTALATGALTDTPQTYTARWYAYLLRQAPGGAEPMACPALKLAAA